MHQLDPHWQPPPYTVRISPRAKRCRFRITPQKGLEIVFPKRSKPNEHTIQTLLYQNRDWISKQFKRLQLESKLIANNETQPRPIALPQHITLTTLAGPQSWQIETIEYIGKAKWIERPEQHLILLHSISEKANQCPPLLIAWCRQQAEQILLPWLKQVSDELQLPYQRASIRAQTARWGSCSEDKAISLNYKLIFFPEKVIRYILIHELCHTVHLNHSADFWQWVKRFDPHYPQHEALLKKERDYIPAWLYTF